MTGVKIMRKNNTWIFYILGVISGMIAIPCIEELLSVCLLWIEWLKILPSKLIAKGNKEIADLHECDTEMQTNVNAIGFKIPDNMEDDEYYE